MTNQLQNTHKNQFSHPGKMVLSAPKLEQFRPDLKLQQICQNWKTPTISTVSAQFRARFQFWSSSFVPNCPNWRESLLFQGLASLEVFRKKTPSPYGRECPYGGNSPRSRVLCVLTSSFPTTNQEVSMEKTNPDSVIRKSRNTPVRRNFRQTENDESVVCAKIAHTTQPILLSLDLGTATGWALSNKHGRIMSGTAHFRPRRFEGGGMRYLRFERWLNETRDVSGKINAVYFEEVRRHLGVDAAHAYGGFLASLTAWCEEHSIPYEGVPVGTIKKFITGKGNAGKQAVIAAVKALGHLPEDDNEADALALLHFAREQMMGGQS